MTTHHLHCRIFAAKIAYAHLPPADRQKIDGAVFLVETELAAARMVGYREGRAEAIRDADELLHATRYLLPSRRLLISDGNVSLAVVVTGK